MRERERCRRYLRRNFDEILNDSCEFLSRSDNKMIQVVLTEPKG